VEIFDGVEDGAQHEFGEPRTQQVRFMAHIALERPARSNASSRPRSSAASVSDMIGIGKTQPSSGGEPDHYHSLDRTTTVNPPPLGCRLDEEKANLPENSDPHRGRRPKTNAALLWSI